MEPQTARLPRLPCHSPVRLRKTKAAVLHRGKSSQYSVAVLPLTENSLISRIRRMASSGRAVRTGIGDDSAVLRIPPGHEALLTTDFSLEGIHFRREWHPPHSVGHRCLARGLSDIAAMGGEP